MARKMKADGYPWNGDVEAEKDPDDPRFGFRLMFYGRNGRVYDSEYYYRRVDEKLTEAVERVLRQHGWYDRNPADAGFEYEVQNKKGGK